MHASAQLPGEFWTGHTHTQHTGYTHTDSRFNCIFALRSYLEFCLEQVVKDNEVGALITGLDGKYVEPGETQMRLLNADYKCHSRLTAD